MKNPALYPFGYGLSYTKFEYSNLTLSKDKVNVGEGIECSVKVKNTGSFKADEIVQLYVKEVDNPEAPRWHLEGFKRINLAPGEKRLLNSANKSSCPL